MHIIAVTANSTVTTDGANVVRMGRASLTYIAHIIRYLSRPPRHSVPSLQCQPTTMCFH